MPTADIGNGEIYYESQGEGETVLLVPGLGGLGSYWAPNISAFSAKYRVIVHDHRGAGRSAHSKIRYSVGQMTEDLLQLMDHLGIRRAHLVGHSTGGAIGQTLALEHPERLASLVLFATWTRCDAFFARAFAARRALLMSAGTAAYARANPVFLYPSWWINDNIALLEEREKIAIPNMPPAEVIASRIDAICAFDRSAELPRIKTPTLVLCAKDDILTPPYFSEELARRIPGARIEQLEKGGHCASETAREAFNEVVLDFIGGLKDAG